MLTIFAIPKPFREHIGMIQRNAIRSWTLLRPRPEIILFGSDEGTAEAALDFEVIHVPEVACNEFGTPLLNDFFEKAENRAANSTLCYVNADIMLLDDFAKAIGRVCALRKKFLMVGQRWDLDIDGPIDFEAAHWRQGLRQRALNNNAQHSPEWIDYFAFSKGLGRGLLPFAIGRTLWDQWLIWHAYSEGAVVVDASKAVIAIHQNHDYVHHSGGKTGVYGGEEARRNTQLMGGWRSHYTTSDANLRLMPDAIQPNNRRWLVKFQRARAHYCRPIWFSFLGLTRPVRHRLGLRQKSAG